MRVDDHKLNNLLFRMAFARARPCYCYGCICLTPDERVYERRVFRLARAVARRQKSDRQTTALLHSARF